jgi:F0F1-type ATP synthase assembly protein I
MTSHGGPPGSRANHEMRIGYRMMGIGLETTSQVAAGVFFGWLVDRWRGQGSVGIAVGGGLGVLVGVISLVRNAWRLNAQLDRAGRKGGDP